LRHFHLNGEKGAGPSAKCQKSPPKGSKSKGWGGKNDGEFLVGYKKGTWSVHQRESSKAKRENQREVLPPVSRPSKKEKQVRKKRLLGGEIKSRSLHAKGGPRKQGSNCPRVGGEEKKKSRHR